MTTAPTGLRRVADHLATDAATDGELLARFLAFRDQDAFTTLARRHAGMVLGTCRRVLGNAADADDAFQAAFLVLVRKAGGLLDRGCVGNFLYGVAFHTSLKAKAMAATRRTREARAEPPAPHADQSELLAALDEELARLPEKYRAPVVLCELEGRSRREVATALGVAEGTISSRLATAHRMLEERLRSRGFAGVVVAALFVGSSVGVSDALALAAVTGALSPSPAVSQLASGVTRMMLLHKLGLGVVGFALLAATAAVAGAMMPHPPAEEPKPAPKVAPAAKAVPVAQEPAWKAEFRKVYGLKDGERVRRVAPPYPDCRAEFFKDQFRQAFRRNKVEPADEQLKEILEDRAGSIVTFRWKDGWSVSESTARPPVKSGGLGLGQLLSLTTGFSRARTDMPKERLGSTITGDWVVRAGADPEKVAAAVEAILRKECMLKVSLSVEEVEKEVWSLSGRYAANPVRGRKVDEIEVYAKEWGGRMVGSGRYGDLAAMAAQVEEFVGSPIVLGKIEDAPKEVSWHFNFRAPASLAQFAEDREPTGVLTNLAAQTGLTAKQEKRKIKVLVVKKAG